jgi:hypothetical protein
MLIAQILINLLVLSLNKSGFEDKSLIDFNAIASTSSTLHKLCVVVSRGAEGPRSGGDAKSVRVFIAPDFNEPLPEEILSDFENSNFVEYPVQTIW